MAPTATRMRSPTSKCRSPKVYYFSVGSAGFLGRFSGDLPATADQADEPLAVRRDRCGGGVVAGRWCVLPVQGFKFVFGERAVARGGLPGQGRSAAAGRRRLRQGSAG